MDKSNNELVKYIAKLFVKICRERNTIDYVLNKQSIEKINNLANTQKRCDVEELLSIIRQESVGYDSEDKENYVYIIKIAIEFAYAVIAHKELSTNSIIFIITFLTIIQTEFINVTRELSDNYVLDNENKINEQLSLLKTNEISYLSTKIKQLENKQKNITKDFIVILGIFAAIFMAFDSGLKIELEILSQVNDYAKGVLIIFIALFTYILLKSFYKFIINIYTDTITEENTIANKLETYKTQKKFLKWIWQHIAHILLALSAILYCILVGLIDKQYEQKIKPIVKEEISKLQQKEEKGNIIIYNNTSSTQNQENGLVQQ